MIGSGFMELSRTQIQYLLTIYEMLEKGPVRLRDIAEAMQVSKPSVHGMEEQFVQMGLLEKKRYSSIQMTVLGQQAAKEYGNLLQLLSGCLEETLGLSPSLSKNSALALLGEWSGEHRQQILQRLWQRVK